MTPEQRGKAMQLAHDWMNRPSADVRPGQVVALGNQMADLLRTVATVYPPTRKPVMWMHRDNPALTTQREPLGSDWVALYKE